MGTSIRVFNRKEHTMKQNELIEIIQTKIKSAHDHYMRLWNDSTYQRDEIMMEHLKGEIYAYKDVIALIKSKGLE